MVKQYWHVDLDGVGVTPFGPRWFSWCDMINFLAGSVTTYAKQVGVTKRFRFENKF